MPQTPTTIPTPLAALLVVIAATVGALLVGAGPALAQDDPANATNTTGIGTDTGVVGETTAGAGVADTTTEAAADTTGDATGGSASVTFEDQTSADGERVLVASATVPEGGFVVIAEGPPTDNGSYGALRGVSYTLGPGTSSDISIELARPINESGTASLIAVLHRDSNGNGEFDYNSSGGQQDGPYTDQEGVVLDLADVTVQAGSGRTSPQPTNTSTGTTAGGVGTDEDTATTAVEATATTTTETTVAETATTDTTVAETATTDTTGGGNGGSNLPGPGFGVVVAVVAVLAAALVAARRT